MRQVGSETRFPWARPGSQHRGRQRHGDLHKGFARVKCKDCGHEYLLAFSCKRHFCPFYHQKRVVEFGGNRLFPSVIVIFYLQRLQGFVGATRNKTCFVLLYQLVTYHFPLSLFCVSLSREFFAFVFAFLGPSLLYIE